MNEFLYVATGRGGVERGPNGDHTWPLPHQGDGGWTAGELLTVNDSSLTLRTSDALLELLDEQIYRATSPDATDADGATEVVVSSAQLVEGTGWNTERAATFALDCVEHILGQSAATELSDGSTLGSIVADAREALASSSETPGIKRLGLLSRFSAARRLRRQGESIGDLALEQLVGDMSSDINGFDDPIWSTLAALGDALLASLEAVRHSAAPRYVDAREETIDDHQIDQPVTNPPVFVTPWGAIAIGAEHRSAFEPAWVAARDAAGRARDAVRDRSGEVGESAEREWQAKRLSELLQP